MTGMTGRLALAVLALVVASGAFGGLAPVSAGAATAAAPAQSASGVTLVVDEAATHIRFELDAGLHMVHGTAKVTQGEIRFDPATGSASGRVVVDARSLETGNGSRDKTMHAEVLESSRFPEIVLTPERLEGTVPAQGEGDVTLSGTLEIHGGKHPIRMPAHVREAAGQLTGTAGFTVPYVAWGMKDPSVFLLRVKKEVPVTIEFSVRVAPQP